MQYLIQLILFSLISFTFLQEKQNVIQNDGSIINSKNYYDFLIKKPGPGTRITSDWIRRDEIVEILVNELKEKGYKIKINGLLFKLDNGEFICINGFEPYKKFGFIVQEGHAADIQKSDRTKNKPFQYMIFNTKGIPMLSYTSELPTNIFIFKEDWYWFQECYGCNDTKTVTRKDAIRILKEDLKNYLNKFQNN